VKNAISALLTKSMACSRRFWWCIPLKRSYDFVDRERHYDMKKPFIFLLFCMSADVNADIYKCTDATGATSYQQKPCPKKMDSYAIDVKTGTHIAITEKKDQRLQEELERQRQAVEEQKKRQLEQQWDDGAKAEQVITQALIHNNPKKFSIYAIPPYRIKQLPAVVQQFKHRLPEIEKLRRLAAQKALETNQCTRVESDELSPRSKKTELVVLVDCSSGKSFYFNEAELTQ
jgi:hypothetical protein